MRFICETCRANLQISDEKLRGKRLIVRCKRCGVQIRIADPALSAQQPRDEETSRPAVPPPPPLQAFATDAAAWFAIVRSDQLGPLTRSQLESRIASGDVHPGTYVWKQQMETWVPAQALRELAAMFPAPPPPPPQAARTAAPMESAEGPMPPLPASPAGESAGSPGPDASVSVSPEDGALGLARWGAAELARTRAETPVPAPVADKRSTPSISKPEFRIGQAERRGSLRAALLVLGAAGVLSLAAFAILYERKEGARHAQEVAQLGASPPAPPGDASPKAPEQKAAPAATPEMGHGTVPSPDVLKKKVDESMPALQGCVDQALQRDPALRVGKILILTTVAPSGEVTSTRIDKKNVDQSQLGACLKSAARNIHFPSFKGEAFPLDIPVVVAGGD